jgi:N-acetylglucosaminyl-diphospho-decaprenol L-rhamnosyltransferase
LKSNIVVVIVNYRTPAAVEQCLISLAAERVGLPRMKVVVVDGGSGDESPFLLAKLISQQAFQDWVSLLALPINGGFGWANNQALLSILCQSNKPDFVHLLNPDTTIQTGAVAALGRFLVKNARAGAVGSQLRNEGGAIAPSAFRFPTVKTEFVRGAKFHRISKLMGIPDNVIPSIDCAVEADWVSGASVMFRVEALKESGLFDVGFFLYHEEVELMWRLRKCGWSVWIDPSSQVFHIGGASTGVRQGQSVNGRGARLPSYWYESRRRLFSLIYGRNGARWAGWSWVVGHIIHAFRRAIGLAGKNVIAIDSELRDHLRFGMRPTPLDGVPAICRWDSEPGNKPAWMGLDD